MFVFFFSFACAADQATYELRDEIRQFRHTMADAAYRGNEFEFIEDHHSALVAELALRRASPAGEAINLYVIKQISHQLGDDCIFVTAHECPKIHHVIEQLAGKLHIRKPLIFIAPATYNAAATGGINLEQGRFYGMVIIGGKLADKVTDYELETILAHEIDHLGHDHPGKTITNIINAGVLGLALTGTALLGYKLLRYGLPKKLPSFQDTKENLSLTLDYGKYIAALLFFGKSQSCEYEADATAAKITGKPKVLAAALERIAPDDKFADVLLQSNGSVDRAFGRLMKLKRKYMATHPLTQDRVAALTKIAAEIESPQSAPNAQCEGGSIAVAQALHLSDKIPFITGLKKMFGISNDTHLFIKD